MVWIPAGENQIEDNFGGMKDQIEEDCRKLQVRRQNSRNFQKFERKIEEIYRILKEMLKHHVLEDIVNLEYEINRKKQQYAAISVIWTAKVFNANRRQL